MLKKIYCLLFSFLFLFPNTAYANDGSISACSAVTMDSATKTVLFEQNAYQHMPMASTTKIMTCLIACESGKLDDLLTVTEEMVDVQGSSVYLKAGDKITLLDLVKGAMIASGNDAANSIAVYLGSSVAHFVAMMNSKAKEIGLKSTHFETPSGLDGKEHYSTAFDMAVLASAALKNQTFAEICAMKSAEITVNEQKQILYNHNKLLNASENFVGVKTGFTKKAGRCLVSAYKIENSFIICVTLNAGDDWNDHKKLISLSKSKYIRICASKIMDINVVGGYKSTIKAKADLNVFSLGNVETKAYYYPFLYAPVAQGDVIGKMDVLFDGNIIATVDITAEEGINIYGK